MRRFEFFDGKSSKFWAVRVDDAELIVSFGRIGTQGQCKSKSFATEAAAKAEEARLIREKTGKGYREVSPGASSAPAVNLDARASRAEPPSNSAVPPERKERAPGAISTPAMTVPARPAEITPALAEAAPGADPSASAHASAETAAADDAGAPVEIGEGLAWPCAGFVWDEALLAQLPVMRGLPIPSSSGDIDDSEPVVGDDAAEPTSLPFDGDPSTCTDVPTWMEAGARSDIYGRPLLKLVHTAAALHGLPFAVDVALSCAAKWRTSRSWLYIYAADRPARSLRARIASACASVHAACVDVAGRFRGIHLELDVLVSYMFPEQVAWAEECASHPGLGEEADSSWLDDTALPPASALRVLRGRYGTAFGWQVYYDSPIAAQTALLQVYLHGVGALPLFDAAIKEYARYPRMRPALERLLGLLERFEAPEMFSVLFRHIELEAVRDSLRRLSARWPAAMFKTALLTPRRGEDIENWAVQLAAHRPEVVDVVLASSTPPERRRLDAVIQSRLRPAEAPWDRIPAVLREAPPDLPTLKGKRSPLPEFFDALALPRLQLQGGGVLPAAAVTVLGRLLAASTLAAPRAELEAVRAACTADSLAGFAWSLFRAWQLAGSPSKQAWAFSALGLIGNDVAAHRLAPLIREWPGQSAHARATLGLDILAALGSDAALMQLNGIAEKVKHAGLQARARERIDGIAAARGLSPVELADRLVPDLGLDARGGTRLDFGPRTFEVFLDDALVPRLRDASGRSIKSLPKPGRDDDSELAEAAIAQFKALKKEAKAVAAMHIPRLERAMCDGRRWRPEAFETVFMAHPVMGLLARRLLWGAYRDRVLIAAFRIAEDHSLADSEDRAYRIGDEDEVGIVHPLELSPAQAAAFGGCFVDYEIMQPFRQLGRETYTLDDADRQAGELLRFKDRKTTPGALMSLAARGWEADTGSHSIRHFVKSFPTGAQVAVELEPGILLGDINAEPEQWLLRVDLPPADADPIRVSELIRDLELAAPG